MPPPEENDLRRRILDTARHLLVRQGFAALSMRKIASAVGYSATTLYLYFDNKDALLHALIDEGFDLLHEALSGAVAMAEPVERLSGLCRGYVAFGLGNPEYYEIMFMLHPEQMARYPAEKYRRARRNLDYFALAIEDGCRAGMLRADAPHVAASAVWAALHGTVSLVLAERLDIRIEEDVFVEAAIGQIVRAYAVPAPAGPG